MGSDETSEQVLEDLSCSELLAILEQRLQAEDPKQNNAEIENKSAIVARLDASRAKVKQRRDEAALQLNGSSPHYRQGGPDSNMTQRDGLTGIAGHMQNLKESQANLINAFLAFSFACSQRALSIHRMLNVRFWRFVSWPSGRLSQQSIAFRICEA